MIYGLISLCVVRHTDWYRSALLSRFMHVMLDACFIKSRRFCALRRRFKIGDVSR